VNLYLDQRTKDALRKEANLFELSPSAFIRVLSRIWEEPVDEVLSITISEFRSRVRKIIEEENRKV